ncbi:MAG TPA: hypothetical protein EYQ08_03605 [Planctomycetes bacterium]|nr:hypothetical protein [Planctomycetota bacterium]
MQVGLHPVTPDSFQGVRHAGSLSRSSQTGKVVTLFLGYDLGNSNGPRKEDLMISLFSSLLLGVFLSVGLSGPADPLEDAVVTTIPDLKIQAVPDSLSQFQQQFSQYTAVFGVHVLATRGVPTEKVRHVAAVLAEYLDNDEDGVADDPRVVEAMAGRQMGMVLFASEREMERLDRSGIDQLGYHHLQGQFAEETKPPGEFDATIEEVLHLVTSGYGEAYPRIFGPRPGTELGDCLDRARGGRFGSVPRRYPEKAWFHYDDRSCDYPCMAVEYLYWALTSLLEAQADPERARQISHEWELTSGKLVRERDPWITALLEDPKYHWATRLPDGRYGPAQGKTKKPQQDEGEPRR